MFNPLKMAGDMKGMEKMLKPALEKFMNDSGFVTAASSHDAVSYVSKNLNSFGARFIFYCA